jgi:hypothetical protein
MSRPGNNDIVIFNVKPREWDELMRTHLIRTTSGFANLGLIIILRRLKSNREDYGVMGFWYINEIIQNRNSQYIVHIDPIFQFNDPFYEELGQSRNLNGKIGINSQKVNGLKSFPYLSRSFINISKSGRSIDIKNAYIRKILMEKGPECNFNEVVIPNIVTYDYVNWFIERLSEFVNQQINIV